MSDLNGLRNLVGLHGHLPETIATNYCAQLKASASLDYPLAGCRSCKGADDLNVILPSERIDVTILHDRFGFQLVALISDEASGYLKVACLDLESAPRSDCERRDFFRCVEEFFIFVRSMPGLDGQLYSEGYRLGCLE